VSNVIDRLIVSDAGDFSRDETRLSRRPIAPFLGISQSRGDSVPRGENIAEDANASWRFIGCAKPAILVSLIRRSLSRQRKITPFVPHYSTRDYSANALGDLGGPGERITRRNETVSLGTSRLEKSNESEIERCGSEAKEHDADYSEAYLERLKSLSSY